MSIIDSKLMLAVFGIWAAQINRSLPVLTCVRVLASLSKQPKRALRALARVRSSENVCAHSVRAGA